MPGAPSKYLIFQRVILQRERLPGLGCMKSRWMPGRDISALVEETFGFNCGYGQHLWLQSQALYLLLCVFALTLMGSKKEGYRDVSQVPRCSHPAHFCSPTGGIHQQSSRAFSCQIWLIALMDVAACTHVLHYPQMAASTQHAGYHIYDLHILEIHTPLRHTYSGPFHSLNIPLAISHWRPQLLLISWVTRHSRWSSALGGTAADVLEKEVFGVWGWWGWSHNSEHICAPLSSILNIPSRPVLRHPP